ncbi:hypothetical protein BKA66DRAFT_566171 [Pyrenochaeta sp. MPI-SDFR-AT-0127]|nr:hypothetical protein BKA66DRAFT_566171 [Pyrenochaeta sp. MPI-SDFR-AT-0127]
MDATTTDSLARRELADLVQQRLPRELRDYIYSHLWDHEVLRNLNYVNQIGKALLPFEYRCVATTPGNNGSIVCMCDRSGIIPDFARAVVVGHQFAYEAVSWLYESLENYHYIGHFDISAFFLADVFHLGLTPSPSSVRHLRVMVYLSARRFKSMNWSGVYESLSLLAKLNLRAGFQLKFYTQSPSRMPLALFAEQMASLMCVVEPAVAEFNAANIPVLLYHASYFNASCLIPNVDIGHMLGAHDKNEWADFTLDRLATAVR